MRVISNKALQDFAAVHPLAAMSLQTWRKTVDSSSFSNFSALRNTFRATDQVGDFYVFDIGGNKYRLVAAIHFNVQKLFVRHVFTHEEYDAWKP